MQQQQRWFAYRRYAVSVVLISSLAIIAHRNEEIKIHLQGRNRDVDFILTDEMKNGIINIWNLYSAGGGTSNASMKMADIGSDINVTIGQD